MGKSIKNIVQLILDRERETYGELIRPKYHNGNKNAKSIKKKPGVRIDLIKM